MRIINIIGASGSGKTSVAKQLDGNIIQSYTTRPERYENEWGHIFVDSVDEVDDEIVAYAKLHDYEYFATHFQFKYDDNIYVVNPDGAEQVHAYFFREEVITIYIAVDEDVRKDRMITRYSEAGYSFDEITDMVESRLIADREEFKSVRCNIVIDGNRPLGDVVEDVSMCLE